MGGVVGRECSVFCACVLVVACGVWVCSWLSGFWWVWDVEGVAFLEELFCLVGGDDAATDGRPLLCVFAACAYGEELGGELWCGYWLCYALTVWVGVA